MQLNAGLIRIRKIIAWLKHPSTYFKNSTIHKCPVCEYRGRLLPLGKHSPRIGRCPGCKSRERHRLFYLYLKKNNIDLLDGRHILHFSPESPLSDILKQNKNYQTADIVPGRGMHTMDMTAINFDDNHFDLIIGNHVLE
ncbi:MAG: hypothetical protein HKN08_04810, partial [Gammaproteobacteria bacterium]|nr:hypothetical protein [Gammaproteobacteria bacterium]